VDALADAMEKVAADPEYRKLCDSNNLLVDFKKGDANRRLLQEQDQKLLKIAQDMRLAKK
jgi:tripartite-type tricarboxylate transporter receptor subunit TctC